MKRSSHKRPGKSPLKAAARRPVGAFLLRLYVAGNSSRSRQAILRVRELCAKDLHGDCTLEVIDIYQDPHRARDAQVVATPTLVREIPRPVRRLIGASGKGNRLLIALGLEVPKESGT